MEGTLSRYLWKTKIDLTEYCDGDSHFVEMREPNVAEFKKLVKLQKNLKEDKDGELVMEALETFCELSATLITNHDFYEDAGQTNKLPSKEVAKFFSDKLDLAQYVMVEFMSKVPLLKGSKKK